MRERASLECLYSTPSTCQDASLEQRRGTLVVVREAVVGEEVTVTGVQEQLRALGRLDELARGGKVLGSPFVVLHHVDLERDARRPRASELGGRKSSGKQQGALGAQALLGQHLRGHHSEREPRIDELARQPIRGASTALHDRAEANLPRVADALVEVGEGLAVVEVGGVDDVSGSSQPVGEREESSSLALCVMEEQYLGHDPRPTTRGGLETSRPRSASGFPPNSTSRRC